MAISNQGYLLLVEDDTILQEHNKALLERKYRLKQAYTLSEARSIIKNEGMPRAIVLDIMLPDGNGIDFLKELRQTSNVPVLILSADDTQEDIVNGLAAGADLYLTKPYEEMIFTNYIKALLRRSEMLPEKMTLGPIELYPASGNAYLDGENMGLSQKEFALLQQFIQYPNKLLSIKDLYQRVWDQEMLDDANSLRRMVSKLRVKLSGSGYTITAEYGMGYILEQE